MNTRIQSIDNNRGTIRYIGCIPESLSTWLGIEWDTGVGSNDGIAKGTRFFQTAPNHASFYKCDKRTGWPKKLLAPLTLRAALQLRYADSATATDDAAVAIYTLSLIHI